MSNVETAEQNLKIAKIECDKFFNAMKVAEREYYAAKPYTMDKGKKLMAFEKAQAAYDHAFEMKIRAICFVDQANDIALLESLKS